MAAILWTIPLLLVTAQASIPPSPVNPSTPLRPTDSALAATVSQGLTDSETFRRLESSIAAAKAVVYIAWTPRLPDPLGAALLPRVTLTPDGTRYLWVLIRRGSRPHLAAVIGHELQHAVEVLDSGAVTAQEIESVFRRLGERYGGPPYETKRAQEVQAQIVQELKAATRGRATSKSPAAGLLDAPTP